MAAASRFSSDSPDAFGLLGLVPRFDIEAAELERAFFDKSKALHPDRFATAPAAERVAALGRSRAVNDAYQLLRREASRAEYLLAREGVVIGDNERIDPVLVMDLLEEREVLAEARQAGNTDELTRLENAMLERRRAALAAVRAGFAVEPHDLAAIKQQLILLRYIERYIEECEHALGED